MYYFEDELLGRREIQIREAIGYSADYERIVKVQERRSRATPAGNAEALDGVCGVSGCCNDGLNMCDTGSSRINHHSKKVLLLRP